MEPQKQPNSQSNFEKEQSLKHHVLFSNHISKLQLSKQYGTGIKMKQTNGTKSGVQK